MKKNLLPIIIYLATGLITQALESAETQEMHQTSDEQWLITDFFYPHLEAPDQQLCSIINESAGPIEAHATITQLDGKKIVYRLPAAVPSTTTMRFLFFYRTMLHMHPQSQTIQLSFTRHDGAQSYEYDICDGIKYLITQSTKQKYDRSTTIVQFPQKINT